MWLLALVSAALAAPSAGFYHPADLVGESQRFAEANRAAAASYEEAARTSVELARALNDYREGLDLLGEAAPAGEYERLAELEKLFNRQHAQAQAFADTLIEDFDAEFSSALDRAKEALGAPLVECERELPEGPQVPGMRPRTKKNPDCQGEDRNAALAAKIDADPKLDAALDEIAALAWPKLELGTMPMQPTAAGIRWVSVRAFVEGGAKNALADIAREDDDARMVFEAAIEEGADAATLKSKVADAQKITEATARKRAELAAPILAAGEAALKKWSSKGEPVTGWCAAPPALGGCLGQDGTTELVPRLLEDKKVAKALPK